MTYQLGNFQDEGQHEPFLNDEFETCRSPKGFDPIDHLSLGQAFYWLSIPRYVIPPSNP